MKSTICRTLVIACPLVLMLAMACTPGISFSEDLGRHILLGRIISEECAVPRTNLLTYTHPDFPFVNHHWLSEVLMYQMHRVAGLNGLIVWKMIMMTAALALAACTVFPRRRLYLYWLAAILAAVLLGFRSHIRPELFTYVGVALYGWLFERMRKGARWPRWAMLPIACLWANAHIYFVFGLGMVGAFVLERIYLDRRNRTAAFEIGWLVALLIVSCINPNGLNGVLYPFRIFSNYAVGITENASPFTYWQTVLNPMLLALPVMGLLTVMAGVGALRAARRKPRPPGERSGALCAGFRPANVIIAVTALVATFVMARSAPLLALTALPLIGAALSAGIGVPASSRQRLFMEDGSPYPSKCTTHAGIGVPASSPRRSPLPLLLVLVLNAWLLHGVVTGWYTRIFPSPIGPTSFGFDHESRYRALTDLKTDGLRGPVFTDYNIGSLVEYALYPEPGYVDNRPEAFPSSFWRTEYEPALALSDRWAAIRDMRGFNAVIVSLHGVKEQFTQEMMRRPGWVLVHLDALSAVWVRNAPRNREIIDKRGFTPARLAGYERQISRRLIALYDTPFWRRQVEADRLVYELYSLLCIGEAGRAWPYIRQLHLLYPDYQIIHELMRVTAPPQDVAMVRDVLSRRARWPLAAKQVLDWGAVLEAEGKAEQAKKLYRRGRSFFPLSPALRDALSRHANIPPTSSRIPTHAITYAQMRVHVSPNRR
ncbi:MAG: hypothetical protein HQ559_13270 [Lentisphaerae bacterium]|nr:hypothetical protein [Lentisphaerota bacterium]